jgi:hypothetical protein
VGQLFTTLRVENPLNEARRAQWCASSLALVIALLLHIGLVVVLPEELLMSQDSLAVAEEDALEVLLVPPEPLLPDELKFVEANPEVPKNEPDRKDQYSFRAQQSADESLSESITDTPHVEGEDASQKIIQGVIEQPPTLTPGVYVPEVQQGEGDGSDGGKAGSARAAYEVPTPQPLPAPDFIQQKPVSEDGPGSSLEIPGVGEDLLEKPLPSAPIHVYQPQPQTVPQTQPLANGSGGNTQPVPRARPRLSPDLVHGPVMRSVGSVSRRGALAIDATFSEFGEYQQQFYAAVQAGWYQEIEFFQPIDTSSRVVVSFRITSDGAIHDVSILYSNASEIASLICETALTKRSPFRPWTQEMVKVFGNERVLKVVFHYH